MQLHLYAFIAEFIQAQIRVAAADKAWGSGIDSEDCIPKSTDAHASFHVCDADLSSATVGIPEYPDGGASKRHLLFVNNRYKKVSSPGCHKLKRYLLAGLGRLLSANIGNDAWPSQRKLVVLRRQYWNAKLRNLTILTD